MLLSAQIRHKIAKIFISGYPRGVFDLGTFFTNGNRLVYVPCDGFNKYDLTLDIDSNEVRIAELFDGSYIDIQQLIPEGQDYVLEYERFIHEYKYEFMQYNCLDAEEFKANYTDEDVINWIFEYHPERLTKPLHELMGLIEETLLNLEN